MDAAPKRLPPWLSQLHQPGRRATITGPKPMGQVIYGMPFRWFIVSSTDEPAWM